MPRLMDAMLSKALDQTGAVEVTGTMWCGKTWTSTAFGNSISRIGLTPARLAAEADPATALLGEAPHVIDEWQDVPAIWDEVRMRIDENAGKPGQFILTGSAQPNKEKVHHSGAGRISRLHMRTMSLQEAGRSSGKVSLAGLFNGEFETQLAAVILDRRDIRKRFLQTFGQEPVVRIFLHFDQVGHLQDFLLSLEGHPEVSAAGNRTYPVFLH